MTLLTMERRALWQWTIGYVTKNCWLWLTLVQLVSAQGNFVFLAIRTGCFGSLTKKPMLSTVALSLKATLQYSIIIMILVIDLCIHVVTPIASSFIL